MEEDVNYRHKEVNENYRTAEIKSEEELERERKDYVQNAEREIRDKAVNARAKRKKHDKTFRNIVFGTIFLILVILLIRYFRTF